MHRYFAYGSNLDLARMFRRCPSARVLGPARLSGFDLRFAGHSRRWNASTATIAPGRGEVVGILYELDDDALCRLDAFEGAPHVYTRDCQEVITDHGDCVEAVVYALPPSIRAGAPDPDYVRLMLHGLRRWGLPVDGVLAATQVPAQRGPCDERSLFVYGTLQRGDRNARRMSHARYLGMARTRPEFALLDLGAFPAITPGAGSVFGEVYAVDAPALDDLDRFEGVPGFYTREPCFLMDGRRVEVYVFASAPGGSAIPSGDWRWHRHRASIQDR